MTMSAIDLSNQKNPAETDQTYQVFLSHLLSGKRSQCFEIVETHLAANTPIKTLYEELFQRALYEVGQLWERNQISVAIEHIATAITEGLMNQIYPRLISGRRTHKRALIASVAGEYHQIGGKMVADIFEMHGWDSFYLGANVPVQELMRFITEIQPNVAGLSLSVYFHMENLRKTLDQLQSHFPHLKVIIGGQAFRIGGAEIADRYPNVRYIATLDALEQFIKGEQDDDSG